jgi:hypothetical protein
MKADFNIEVEYDEKKEVMSMDVGLIPEKQRNALPNKIKKMVRDMDPSRIGKKSNRKGGAFERNIYNGLNERFKHKGEIQEDGKPEAQFTRVPRSGGIFGGKNKERLSGISDEAKRVLSGDLIVPEYFRFSIECKNHKGYPKLHSLFTKEGCTKMNEWISQAKDDIVGTEDWMIIFHIDLIGDFVVIDALHIALMDTEPGKIPEYANSVTILPGNLALIPFKDLLEFPDEFFLW